MDQICSKSYAYDSSHGNKKFVHEGRMYFKERSLKGINIGKVTASCDRKLYGCRGRAWFHEGGDFIK